MLLAAVAERGTPAAVEILVGELASAVGVAVAIVAADVVATVDVVVVVFAAVVAAAEVSVHPCQEPAAAADRAVQTSLVEFAAVAYRDMVYLAAAVAAPAVELVAAALDAADAAVVSVVASFAAAVAAAGSCQASFQDAADQASYRGASQVSPYRGEKASSLQTVVQGHLAASPFSDWDGRSVHRKCLVACLAAFPWDRSCAVSGRTCLEDPSAKPLVAVPLAWHREAGCWNQKHLAFLGDLPAAVDDDSIVEDSLEFQALLA